jgi:hypothetical protein
MHPQRYGIIVRVPRSQFAGAGLMPEPRLRNCADVGNADPTKASVDVLHTPMNLS